MLPLDADSCGYIVVEFTNRHKRQCKKMTFVTVRNVHDHITEYISSFVSSKATEFREWKSSLELLKIFKNYGQTCCNSYNSCHITMMATTTVPFIKKTPIWLLLQPP